MSLLFLDSSVLIDHLNDRQTPAVTLLRATLGIRELVIGDLVLMEVLQGLRDERSVKLTAGIMSMFQCLELGGVGRVTEAAGVYRLLRAAGVTPRSTVDVLIASFCARERIELLASDRDFRLMAPYIGLRLAVPSVS